jgi:hypothetical protein
VSRLGAASIISCLAVGLAACQPQARRLLFLDEALTQAAELEATAKPWRDAGYRVDYRRYYPHLTRADLDHYRTVLILGGRRPAPGSDALDAGDVSLMTEWTLRGGVIVLGYPPEGEGAFDRWLMNHWLAWSGAGITIGDFALRDAAHPAARPLAQPVLNTGLRGTGFGSFPAGVNDVLLVEDPAATLAYTNAGAVERPPGLRPATRTHAPIVAASRVANGLVVVLSRSALGAAGQPDSAGVAGTRTFLVSLARWTRRPAEWARIPSAGPRARLQLEGGPLPVVARAPRAAAPPGAAVERLERVGPSTPAHGVTTIPGWITRHGVRALEGDFPALAPTTAGSARLAALDSLTRLLDVGAFNLLVTNAHVAPLADSSRSQRWERDAVRAAWQLVAARLQSTSVRWLPFVLPGELAAASDSAPGEPCPLDPVLWGKLASGIRVLARFAATRTELIPAVGLSLDRTTEGWGAPPFCDAAWQAGLGALPRDPTRPRNRLSRLAAVPRAARYDSLLEGGLIAAFDSAVARVVTQRAAALRADVRRIRRSVLLALVMDRSPTDWFTRSLVLGMSTPDAPVLVFSPDPGARALLNTGDTAMVLHIIRLDPGLVMKAGAARLGQTVFQDHEGFWLGPAEALLAGPSDSLAQLVRRLAKER